RNGLLIRPGGYWQELIPIGSHAPVDFPHFITRRDWREVDPPLGYSSWILSTRALFTSRGSRGDHTRAMALLANLLGLQGHCCARAERGSAAAEIPALQTHSSRLSDHGDQGSAVLVSATGWAVAIATLVRSMS